MAPGDPKHESVAWTTWKGLLKKTMQVDQQLLESAFAEVD